MVTRNPLTIYFLVAASPRDCELRWEIGAGYRGWTRAGHKWYIAAVTFKGKALLSTVRRIMLAGPVFHIWRERKTRMHGRQPRRLVLVMEDVRNLVKTKTALLISYDRSPANAYLLRNWGINVERDFGILLYCWNASVYLWTMRAWPSFLYILVIINTCLTCPKNKIHSAQVRVSRNYTIVSVWN